MSTECPRCSRPLGALGRYCDRCEEYVADMTSEGPDEAPAPTAPPDDRLEADIRLAIRRVLELCGFDVYDLEQNRPTRQTAGLADLYAVGHGRCAWVEVKRPKGRQSGAQETFEARVRANGGEYLVMRHEDEAMAWAQAVRSDVA